MLSVMSFPSLNSESVTSGKLLTQYFYPEKRNAEFASIVRC